jgi:hypothetical protein
VPFGRFSTVSQWDELLQPDSLNCSKPPSEFWPSLGVSQNFEAAVTEKIAALRSTAFLRASMAVRVGLPPIVASQHSSTTLY